MLEFKTWISDFCFHVGPWENVQGGRVLDPESDDLVESSSSHTYRWVVLAKALHAAEETLCLCRAILCSS